jgi:hypothetical protein
MSGTSFADLVALCEEPETIEEFESLYTLAQPSTLENALPDEFRRRMLAALCAFHAKAPASFFAGTHYGPQDFVLKTHKKKKVRASVAAAASFVLGDSDESDSDDDDTPTQFAAYRDAISHLHREPKPLVPVVSKERSDAASDRVAKRHTFHELLCQTIRVYIGSIATCAPSFPDVRDRKRAYEKFMKQYPKMPLGLLKATFEQCDDFFNNNVQDYATALLSVYTLVRASAHPDRKDRLEPGLLATRLANSAPGTALRKKIEAALEVVSPETSFERLKELALAVDTDTEKVLDAVCDRIDAEIDRELIEKYYILSSVDENVHRLQCDLMSMPCTAGYSRMDALNVVFMVGIMGTDARDATAADRAKAALTAAPSACPLHDHPEAGVLRAVVGGLIALSKTPVPEEQVDAAARIMLVPKMKGLKQQAQDDVKSGKAVDFGKRLQALTNAALNANRKSVRETLENTAVDVQCASFERTAAYAEYYVWVLNVCEVLDADANARAFMSTCETPEFYAQIESSAMCGPTRTHYVPHVAASVFSVLTHCPADQSLAKYLRDNPKHFKLREISAHLQERYSTPADCTELVDLHRELCAMSASMYFIPPPNAILVLSKAFDYQGAKLIRAEDALHKYASEPTDSEEKEIKELVARLDAARLKHKETLDEISASRVEKAKAAQEALEARERARRDEVANLEQEATKWADENEAASAAREDAGDDAPQDADTSTSPPPDDAGASSAPPLADAAVKKRTGREGGEMLRRTVRADMIARGLDPDLPVPGDPEYVR